MIPQTLFLLATIALSVTLGWQLRGMRIERDCREQRREGFEAGWNAGRRSRMLRASVA